MIPDARKAQVIEVFSRAAVDQLNRAGQLPVWEQLPPMFKHQHIEHIANLFECVWPLLEDREPIILRHRVAVLVAELKDRGEPLLAAEVETIATEPIGD